MGDIDGRAFTRRLPIEKVAAVGNRHWWYKWEPGRWQSEKHLIGAPLRCRGLWRELLDYMYMEHSDRYTGTIDDMAGLTRARVPDVRKALGELLASNLADYSVEDEAPDCGCNGAKHNGNAKYTIICRGISAVIESEEKARSGNAERQRRYREKHKKGGHGNAKVTATQARARASSSFEEGYRGKLPTPVLMDAEWFEDEKQGKSFLATLRDEGGGLARGLLKGAAYKKHSADSLVIYAAGKERREGIVIHLGPLTEQALGLRLVVERK